MNELLNKIFTSAEMKAEFQHYAALQTEAERNAFFASLKEKLSEETAEAQKERIDKLLEAGYRAAEAGEELIVLKKLQSVAPYISLSEISRTYFGKSRGWLSQRLHENTVRGKKMKLKPEEIKTLQNAFIEIAEKLNNTARSLSFS